MPTEALNPLGEFLRARRELADPVDLGLPAVGHRRVRGLRREELALLAGMSPHYYARLEQGRNRHPSPQVLEAIARVLVLDDESLQLMRQLADAGPARPSRRARRPERVRPALAALAQRWTSEAVIIIGRYRDVLVANDLATALNPGYAVGRNLVRDAFLEPSVRDVYVDWAEIAEAAVAALRASAGTALDDLRMTELVGELSLKSDEFRRMWARHDVRQKPGGWKRFDNPLVGRLTLHVEPLRVPQDEGQTMYVLFAEPGTPDAQSMTLLATLAHAPEPEPAR